MVRNLTVSHLLLALVLLALTATLALFSASAVVALPESGGVYEAESQLTQLNRVVHHRLVTAWSQKRPLSSPEAVVALLKHTKTLLGLEAQFAVIRLPGDREQRAVMAWNGRYYDPVLDQSFTRDELATVIRTISYTSALDNPRSHP